MDSSRHWEHPPPISSQDPLQGRQAAEDGAKWLLGDQLLVSVQRGDTHQSLRGSCSLWSVCQVLLPTSPQAFSLYRWSPTLPPPALLHPPHLSSHSTSGFLPPAPPSALLPFLFLAPLSKVRIHVEGVGGNWEKDPNQETMTPSTNYSDVEPTGVWLPWQ